MSDKITLCFGDVGLTDPHYGFTNYDATADKWTLNEIKLNEYFCAIANAGANAIRILPWSVWWERPYGIRSQFQAYRLLGGKFDLEEYNDYYFPIMRRILAIAKEYHLKAWFPLLDNCQLSGDKFRQYSPWVNNVQGIGSFYERAAEKHVAKWIRKCNEQFSGLDVNYAFGNETNDPAFEGICKRVILPIVVDLEIDPSRLAFGATMEPTAYLGGGFYADDNSTLKKLQSLVSLGMGDDYLLEMTREIHGCGAPLPDSDISRPFGHNFHQALDWWGNHRIRIMLRDDGVWNGDSLCDREDDRHVRPSAATLKGMVAYALKYYDSTWMRLSFEHLPKGGNLACQVISLRAMADAYQDRFGVKMENVDRHIYTPPISEPIPEPIPEPEPIPQPTTCKGKYIANRPWWKWQVWAYIKCWLKGGLR